MTPAFSLFGVGHPDGAQGHGIVRAMLDRIVMGDVPAKHHTQLRGADGALRFEECFTRDGFDGPFTILYHLGRPHLQQPDVIGHGWTAPTIDDGRPLAKRHYLSGMVARTGGAPVDAFVPMLHNADLVCGVATYALEFLRDAPPLDALYVPIGMGSGICGLIRVRDLLGAAGFPTAEDAQRGYDHGVFVPLLLATPEADIPVVQLSLRSDLDPAGHLGGARDELGALLVEDVGGDHVRPLRRGEQRLGGALPLRGAGDDDGLAGEPHARPTGIPTATQRLRWRPSPVISPTSRSPGDKLMP